jgi:ankyrin repeat protein
MKKSDGYYAINTMLLKKLRKKKKMTQKIAAKKIGITAWHLSRIENDDASPSLSTIQKISKFYRKKQHELFTWTNTLIDTMRRGNKKTILEYIEEHQDQVDGIDSSGNSPLHVASSLRYCEETKVLINKGANLFYQNPDDGFTFLMVACKNGYLEIVDTIFTECQKGDLAKLLFNHKDNNGNTAFLWAAREGRKDICEYLINWVETNYAHRKGELIEAQNKKKKTAFIRAAGFNDINMALLLIHHNANISHKDYNGRTAKDIAKENGNEDIVEIINRFEAGLGLDHSKMVNSDEKERFIMSNKRYISEIKSKLMHIHEESKDVNQLLSRVLG